MNPTDHNDHPKSTTESTPGPVSESAGSAGELATVHQLPGRSDQHQSSPGGAVESAPDVIEGEIVTDEEWALLTDQKARRDARYAGYKADLTAAARKTVTVAKGGTGLAKSKGGPAVRFAHRHVAIIAKGAEAERQRRKAEKGQTDARAARRAALEKNELDRVAELNSQIIEQRRLKAEAAKLRFELGWEITKKTALVLVILLGISMLAGIVNGFGGWFGNWNLTDVLRTIGTIFTTGAAVMTWSVLHIWLFGLATAGVWAFRRWKDGKALGEHVLPENLRTSTSARVAYLELTENALITALANLGNAKLNGHIKAGWPNRDTDHPWVRPPMLAEGGRGYSAKLRLPMGASVADIRRANELLAHNLGCLPQELFIDADPDDPTVMDLFRLEPGVLREPVEAYPLLTDGSTDFFAGFPVGMSPRGSVVETTVNERNFVFSGTMGSGKTTMILALLAGAALDPLVDIDVFVFADNNDFTPLEPVLSTYVKGDTPENVDACLSHIKNLHADLAKRGELLVKHGVKEVNREVAAKEPGLRPRIVVIDECQSFFRQGEPKERAELIDWVVRFYSAARKYGVVLVFATPVPSDKSLPRDLVSVTSNKACGAIGDKTRNNVVLGDKAHENGISALGLKPKTKDALNDAGTLVTVGFMDSPGVVRSFYLNGDQLAAIAARGAEMRGGATTPATPAGPVERDIIADLTTVMTGEDAVNAGDLVGALRNLAPGYKPYKALTKTKLVALLREEYGLKIPSTDNLYPVDPVTVRQLHVGRTALLEQGDDQA
ncbi:ATP-binding protein [Amycolatopsis sp. NPDC051045]|uniref:ATP-binding protein n=1 Tax=Amycolatopsis sp. NPDC051045 TaxID=3156922 RepID=UPI003443D12D